MTYIKYFPLLDLYREKAQKLNVEISSNINSELVFVDNIEAADVILVWWWDWFLLDSIAKYWNLEKTFFWVNCGTKWFLLNQIDSISQLPTKLNQIELIDENLVKVEIITDSWIETKYSINDIVIWNNLNWMINFEVNWDSLNHTFRWSWMILTWSIWCTGYWLSGGGPLLPLKWNLWWIMWIFTLPFNFDVLQPQNIKIIPTSREKVNVWIDWKTWFVDDVKEINISLSDKIVKLWFIDFKKFQNTRLEFYAEKIWVRK